MSVAASALYTPSPVQKEFHDSAADETLFAGSAGPGKSLALRMDPLDVIAVEHDRVRKGEIRRSTAVILFLRRLSTSLDEAVRLGTEVYQSIDPGFRTVDEKSRVVGTFTSGVEYVWSHMKDTDAYLSHRSKAYVRVYWDELTEFEEEQYVQMLSRIRSTDPVLRQMLRSKAATNPAPGWVRDRFVEPAPQGRVLLTKRLRRKDGTIGTRTRLFIPARLADNPDPVFREQYETNLLDQPAHVRAALLDGNWYVVAGAFFADVFDPDTVVIRPFKVPKTWRRFRAMDWGLKSPCVVLWFAITPDDELVCYRERTFNGPGAKRLLSAYDVAKEIRDIEKAHGEWNTRKDISRLTGPADTQLWEDRGQRGATMAGDMAEVGVFWQKATKGRRQAAQQVYRRLKQRGPNGRPGLMFFEGCVQCIKTIPSLPVDPTDPEVPQKGPKDHWYDGVSYACAQNIVSSEDMEDEPRDEDDEADELEARRSWGRYGYGRKYGRNG